MGSKGNHRRQKKTHIFIFCLYMFVFVVFVLSGGGRSTSQLFLSCLCVENVHTLPFITKPLVRSVILLGTPMKNRFGSYGTTTTAWCQDGGVFSLMQKTGCDVLTKEDCNRNYLWSICVPILSPIPTSIWLRPLGKKQIQ